MNKRVKTPIVKEADKLWSTGKELETTNPELAKQYFARAEEKYKKQDEYDKNKK